MHRATERSPAVQLPSSLAPSPAGRELPARRRQSLCGAPQISSTSRWVSISRSSSTMLPVLGWSRPGPSPATCSQALPSSARASSPMATLFRAAGGASTPPTTPRRSPPPTPRCSPGSGTAAPVLRARSLAGSTNPSIRSATPAQTPCKRSLQIPLRRSTTSEQRPCPRPANAYVRSRAGCTVPIVSSAGR